MILVEDIALCYIIKYTMYVITITTIYYVFN